jgi:DNA-binding GntR family transcriptional regulator
VKYPIEDERHNGRAKLADAKVSRAPSPVRSQVSAYLREAIINRRLLPGEPLVEREICEATTASRTSVREALRELEAEGLISTSGRGATVATLTGAEAQEVYAVREVLEGLAGRLFAQNASPEDLKAMADAVDVLSGLLSSPYDMNAAKRQFYDALLDGARNTSLRKMLGLIHGKIALMRSVSLAVPGRPAESLQELRDILEAAQSRDPDATEQACRRHIINAAETVRTSAASAK